MYLKHKAYYLVRRPIGQSSPKWIRLCSEREGEIGLYQALASLRLQETTQAITMSFLADKYLMDEFIPKNDKGSVEKTNKAISNVAYKVKAIKAAMGENLVADITSKFLKDFLEIEFMPSIRPGLTPAERKLAKEKKTSLAPLTRIVPS